MSKKTHKILSLDPGGTTGLALISFTETSEPTLVRAWQEKDSLKGFLNSESKQEDFDIIVCESFTLRGDIKQPDLSPVYIIGALEERYPNIEIVYQRPSMKPLCKDDTLKAMQLYQRGMPHANDAIRHGIIYLIRNRHLPTLKMGWPND